MLFDNYTLQRVVNREAGQGWLVLCDKETNELARCDMPSDVLTFHLKRAKLERQALGLSDDVDLDVELAVWADLEGNLKGHLLFNDGVQRDLTETELKAVIRLDKQQKRISIVERHLLSELISGYISTLPVDETEETTYVEEPLQ